MLWIRHLIFGVIAAGSGLALCILAWLAAVRLRGESLPFAIGVNATGWVLTPVLIAALALAASAGMILSYLHFR